MKAFEKWYNELPMREDEIDFTIPTYENYKRGWKAALEWALETRPMDRFGISKVNCIQVSDIKKELEQ